MLLILVYLNDIPVGTICCRLDSKDGQAKLYLMTMGILSVSPSLSGFLLTSLIQSVMQPYRSRSVGSQALKKVLDAASLDRKPKITHVYLHVQISNTEAKRFYERHGFKEVGIAKDYYKKITPHDAWILELDIKARS